MLLFLAACVDEPDEPAGTTTPSPEDTGPAVPHVEAALAEMPACKPGSDDGTLDIEAGCAGDLCLGSSWPEVQDALGPADTCFFLVDSATCFWGGLVASFADDDADGTPNDDATAYAIAINPPWDGGTADGLALDATLRCFVDVLGTPDGVSFRSYPSGWVVSAMSWDDLFFALYDFQDADGAGTPDGLPDFVQFTNYLFL